MTVEPPSPSRVRPPRSSETPVRVIVTIAIVGGVFGGILIGVIGNTVVGIATR